MRRLRASLTCGIFLVALWTAGVARAQDDVWQPSGGPYGGSIWAFTVTSNGDVFAGSDGGGLFRSRDEGEHWTDVGLRGIHVLCFTEQSDGDVYAGTIFDGVFRSVDHGDTWTQVIAGLPNTGTLDYPRYTVSALVATPDGDLFVGTGEYIQQFAGDGVYRSTDDGTSWSRVVPDLAGAIAPALAVTPDGTLFAGAVDRGLYRSADGGDTWTLTGFQGISVTSVCDLGNERVLAGLTPGGISLSLDGGRTWNATSLSNPGAGVHSIAETPRGHVYTAIRGAGPFRSTDGGATWTRVNIPPFVFAFAFTSRNTGFAGGSGGVSRSTDNGRTWTESNVGIAAYRVRAVVGVSAGTMFCSGDSSGLFRTLDLGDTWTRLGFTNQCVQTLFASPDGAVLAGVAPGCGGNTGGVFRSTDYGRKWTNITGNLGNESISVLAVDHDGRIYAGTGMREARSGGVGIFRSTSDGASWTNVSRGLTNLDVWALAVTADGNLLAGTGDGLYRSTDRGDHWTELDTGLPEGDIQAIVVNPLNGHVFVGASGHGVVRSTDNGASWTRVNNGLASVGGVLSLSINTRGDVFAGGYGGVAVTSDEGDNWTGISAGLRNPNATAVAATPDGYVFAGGYASSLFRTIRSTTAAPDAIGISGAECRGKNLFVYGTNFDSGAIVLVEGVAQSTRHGDGDASRELVADGASKKMPRGRPVLVQVRNGDGRLSRVFSVVRPVKR